MTFPNAYHGVKKIFTAQILKIIGGVLLFLGAVSGLVALALTGVEESVEGSASVAIIFYVIASVFLLAAGVLTIIAFIMNIVGLRQGGLDEEGFRLGFIAACFAMIIKFISILFSYLNVGGGIADNIADTITYICEIIIIVSVIGSINSLADRLGFSNISALGAKLMNILIAVIGLSALITVVPLFFGLGVGYSTPAYILSLVATSLSIVGYIVYLVFLGKGMKMLKEN